jgi:hypothetical protein
VAHCNAPLSHGALGITLGNLLKGQARLLVLEGMQESDRTIEGGFHVFRAGIGKVDGAEFFGGELMVVALVSTSERGEQEKRRTRSEHPTHTASEK